MTYNVQLFSGGYLGWKSLQRTEEAQRSVFYGSAEIRRAQDGFLDGIQNVKSADDLVSNYKLLKVALTALGLESDIGNKAFIKKILESDPNDKGSIVSRVSDKRYLDLNEMFSRVMTQDRDGVSIYASEIADMYAEKVFERSVGEQYQEIELALNARRELAKLADAESSNDTKWYRILSSKPLRAVLEGAFGFGESFGQLPIDRQLSEMKSNLHRLTGSAEVGQFSESSQVELVLRHYLLRTQLTVGGGINSYSAALQILRG